MLRTYPGLPKISRQIQWIDAQNQNQWAICWTTFTARLSEDQMYWRVYYGMLTARTYLAQH